jgi:hypothetical protein
MDETVEGDRILIYTVSQKDGDIPVCAIDSNHNATKLLVSEMFNNLRTANSRCKLDLDRNSEVPVGR